ncbi:MAG: tyrosine--tRNA ligase [Parcubacteria group bacterium]
MNNTDVQEAISRSVATFIDPEGLFRSKLEKKISGEYTGEIVIKIGVDPTRPDLHLGHAVILRKLRQFQEMGCKVIFLVGDLTAQIGDPSGKTKVRPEVTQAEIATNMKTYLDQVGKILRTDEKVFSWMANSDWFTGVTDIVPPPTTKIEFEGKKVDPNSFVGKAIFYESSRVQKKLLNLPGTRSTSLINFLSVLRHITHSQLIARDLFQNRIKEGEELFMHEMMYPVLQGIDSAVIAQIYGSCDMEIGGTDQTFNMLMGRNVMKMSKLPEQAVMALEILPGLDGKEKMSKSLDNYIAIIDEPSDMYGKVMSVPDSCILTYFKLATYTPLSEIEKMNIGKNPKDLKMRLAREIVAIYHGDEASQKALKNFTETFSNKGVPEDVPILKSAPGPKLMDLLLSQKIVESKSEWRRLVEEGAVTNALTEEKITSADATFEEEITLRVGKRRFIKITLL